MSQHLWATYPLCELPMYVAFHVFNCVLGAQGKRCANCDCSELVLGAEMVDWRESSTKNLDNCRKSMDTYLIVTANARTALAFFIRFTGNPILSRISYFVGISVLNTTRRSWQDTTTRHHMHWNCSP